jgi:hypothetical protein
VARGCLAIDSIYRIDISRANHHARGGYGVRPDTRGPLFRLHAVPFIETEPSATRKSE